MKSSGPLPIDVRDGTSPLDLASDRRTRGKALLLGSVLVLPILAVLAVVTHLAFPTPRSLS